MRGADTIGRNLSYLRMLRILQLGSLGIFWALWAIKWCLNFVSRVVDLPSIPWCFLNYAEKLQFRHMGGPILSSKYNWSPIWNCGRLNLMKSHETKVVPLGYFDWDSIIVFKIKKQTWDLQLSDSTLIKSIHQIFHLHIFSTPIYTQG